MSTLIPVHASNHVLEGVSEYLATTFSLASQDTSAALKAFLEDSKQGMFHGPYVRTRLPYARATGWEGLLGWLPDWFKPYHHQAQAFRRLRSLDEGGQRRPEPTLVITGTGSGKTEAFLYPVLDHARRMRAQGQRGVKALLLYPMNALANDQANRLATLLTEEAALTGVTAGIYTGEQAGSNVTKVSKKSLITSRQQIQQDPPDILLTNYKMLDQLLLRPADREIWRNSATSLQYIVLDEFHTYDGAQGTDVALLLRRLGLQLKKHQPTGFLSPEAAARPLGQVTPVATSATLGGEDEAHKVLGFAKTIFGETFNEDALVGETVLSYEQWREEIAQAYGQAHTDAFVQVDADVIRGVVEKVAARVEAGEEYAATCLAVFRGELLHCADNLDATIAAFAAHPLTKAVLQASAHAIPLTQREGSAQDTLPHRVLDSQDQYLVRAVGEETAAEFTTHALTVVSYLRALAGDAYGFEGKRLPGVETHLWVREVSRVDRAVTPVEDGHIFRWSDDGAVEETGDSAVWLPACYCRKCGRAGWMTSLEPGTDSPVFDVAKIRAGSIEERSRQRALLDATNEYHQAQKRGTAFTTGGSGSDARALLWLHTGTRELSRTQPSEEALADGLSVPVLTFAGLEADELAQAQTCPSCGEADSIRYIGSAVATLLSVGLSNLFGMADLESREKKTLVFADTVQDAAHRAGFVQSRSHAFGLRTFMYNAVGDEVLSLADVPRRMVEAADASGEKYRARYELLPAEIAHTPNFRAFWDPDADPQSRRASRTSALERIAFDVALEFGQRADLPRSLAQTGALSVAVDVPDAVLESAGKVALDAVASPTTAMQDKRLRMQWLRGLLEQVRERGAINHPWLKQYLTNDGNAWFVNNRNAKSRGVPSFPRGGAPEFPRSGKKIDDKDRGITPLGSPRGRYAQWTEKVLGITPHDAATVLTTLFHELANRDVLTAIQTQSGGIMYALEPEQIILTQETQPHVLECNVCNAHMALAATTRTLLTGMACTTQGCPGTFEQTAVPANYYRTLYTSKQVRSVVAAEHTGLIPKDERLALERTFRGDLTSGTPAPDAPNVLVATPTLEMGIDIGDLSTVMLSSLPNSVANYVQRVGRAGRLTGNSLVLAFVRGRGASLPKLNQPLSVIAGSVEPPAAFLSATEILHRQITAYVIDSIDFDVLGIQLRQATSVFSPKARPAPLVDVLVEHQHDAHESNAWVDEFLGTLDAEHVDKETLEHAREWALGGGPDSMAGDLKRAQQRWEQHVRVYQERERVLDARWKELEKLNASNQDERHKDEDLERELRAVKSALRRVRRDLKELALDEHWVSAMERYGLLPNFALLDDSVELSVSVSTLNPSTLELEPEPFELTRGVASALQEFAPGATFYARGIAARIDSVELGDDASDVTAWRLCPACSYAEPADAREPGACPVCHSAAFADNGQCIDAVHLRKVSASVDRSQATIDGRSEHRVSTWFHSTMSFSVPEHGQGGAWYLSGGFGAEYLRVVDLSWFNLGNGHAVPRMFAGREIQAPLFTVCKHCGHLDSARGENSKWDHRPWCPQRNELNEDVMSVALARTLRTQGVLLHIPERFSAGDNTTIPSLAAAIRLGFKEVLGGDPDHLNVTPVKVPKESGGAVEALMLHDNVPGGTGYLSQFADPESVRNLLLRAYERVVSCTCAADERLACPQCLLPYARPQQIEVTSRAAAQRALLSILADQDHPDPATDPASVTWDPQREAPIIDQGSQLEIRFRETLRQALEDRNAEITQRPTATSMEWHIRFPSGEQWVMNEQEDFGYTRPDFLFRHRSNRQVRSVALFTDGYAYHASPDVFRFASDMDKRARLATEHYLPWTITHQDLNWFDAETKGTAHPPAWRDSRGMAQGGALPALDSQAMETIVSSPLTQLLHYLDNPRDKAFASYGEGLTVLLLARMFSAGSAPDGSVLRYLNDIELTFEQIGNRLLPTTLNIDVTGHSLPTELWNDYLRFSNLLYLSDEPVTVTTSESTSASVPTMPAVPSGPEVGVDKPVADEVAPEWVEAIEEFEGEGAVTEALQKLAAAGASTNILVGEELEGLMTVVQWPERHVVVLYDAADAESPSEAALRRAGWTVLTPETITDDAMRKVMP